MPPPAARAPEERLDDGGDERYEVEVEDEPLASRSKIRLKSSQLLLVLARCAASGNSNAAQ